MMTSFFLDPRIMNDKTIQKKYIFTYIQKMMQLASHKKGTQYTAEESALLKFFGITEESEWANIMKYRNPLTAYFYTIAYDIAGKGSKFKRSNPNIDSSEDNNK